MGFILLVWDKTPTGRSRFVTCEIEITNLFSMLVTANQLVFAQQLESKLRSSLINGNRRLVLVSKH